MIWWRLEQPPNLMPRCGGAAVAAAVGWLGPTLWSCGVFIWAACGRLVLHSNLRGGAARVVALSACRERVKLGRNLRKEKNSTGKKHKKCVYIYIHIYRVSPRKAWWSWRVWMHQTECCLILQSFDSLI